jgi:hypothetical protein
MNNRGEEIGMGKGMTKVFMKEGGQHFLKGCLDIFPEGIPVTTPLPISDYEEGYSDWDNLPLSRKVWDTVQVFCECWSLGMALHPWVLKYWPKYREYSYIVDSDKFTPEQYQRVRRKFFEGIEEGLDKTREPEILELSKEELSELKGYLKSLYNPSNPLRGNIYIKPEQVREVVG